MPPRRALLVVNANSRNGASLRREAVDALTAAGIEPLPRDCRAREDLSPLIAAHAAEVDCVVVGGGDGTLNAAALGAVAGDLPLGILPLGTANDLARTLDIPADLGAAARIVAAGLERRIDLGIVNDRPFFNVASIGMSAELAQALTGDIKRRFGRFGYGIMALKVLARARPFHAMIVSAEGSVRVRTLQVAVGNGRYYGGGNAVHKDAAIDDRLLDLYSLEVERTWTLALMARAFRVGEHVSFEEVRAIRATAFEVRTRRPRPVNADGEIVTRTPARFTVRPAAVRVFAPNGALSATR